MSAARLSPWLWLVFPPVMPLLQYALRAIDIGFYRRWIEPELGLVELATPALLVPAILLALALFARRRELPSPWSGRWFLLLGLGCIYFAGEELSWGQHLFGWTTPEAIRLLNDQGETNLHNMSSWLDQKPRALLKAFVLLGGVIVPLLLAPKGGFARADWRHWFWPDRHVLPTALLVLVLSIPPYLEKFAGLATPHPFDIRASETIEYLYALFLLIYLASAWRRLGPADKSQ